MPTVVLGGFATHPRYAKLTLASAGSKQRGGGAPPAAAHKRHKIGNNVICIVGGGLARIAKTRVLQAVPASDCNPVGQLNAKQSRPDHRTVCESCATLS